ncbi:MAG TPA: hypothetical protein VK171_12145, partial [Fimbriimonas sp.]|nr:hypothetical protein [Fimbriimonas sp.]
MIWILLNARLKPAQPLYEETSTEDKAKIQKLQNELAAATEHQEKIAEVHAYTLALEQKIKDLESLPGGDTVELGMKVKILESQLAEKADVEAKLAVALQQLEDFKAKADIFDSVVGASSTIEIPEPVEEEPAAFADPIEELVAEMPVEEEYEPVAEEELVARSPFAEPEPVFEEAPAVAEVDPEPVVAVEPEVEEPVVAAPVVTAPVVEEPKIEAPAVAEAPVVAQPVAPAAAAPVATPAAPVEEYAPAAAHQELEAVGMTVLENDSPQREPISAGATAPAISERPALRVESVAAPILLDNRDPLEKIDGIGQVYQIKLYEAGILTFAQLAAASP